MRRASGRRTARRRGRLSRTTSPRHLRGTPRKRALARRVRSRIRFFVGFETERLPPGEWAGRMRASARGAPRLHVGTSTTATLRRRLHPERTLPSPTASGRRADAGALLLALTDLIEALSRSRGPHRLIRKFDARKQFSPRVLRHRPTLEAAKAFRLRLDVNCGAWRRGWPGLPCPPSRAGSRHGHPGTLGDAAMAWQRRVGLSACLERSAPPESKRQLPHPRDAAVRWTRLRRRTSRRDEQAMRWTAHPVAQAESLGSLQGIRPRPASAGEETRWPRPQRPGAACLATHRTRASDDQRLSRASASRRGGARLSRSGRRVAGCAFVGRTGTSRGGAPRRDHGPDFLPLDERGS